MKTLYTNKKKSNLKDAIRTLHVDHAWVEIVGTIRVANSSNFAKVRLAKVLKIWGVVCIVTKMSQTSTLASMDWPTPSLISCNVKKLWELQQLA